MRARSTIVRVYWQRPRRAFYLGAAAGHGRLLYVYCARAGWFVATPSSVTSSAASHEAHDHLCRGRVQCAIILFRKIAPVMAKQILYAVEELVRRCD